VRNEKCGLGARPIHPTAVDEPKRTVVSIERLAGAMSGWEFSLISSSELIDEPPAPISSANGHMLVGRYESGLNGPIVPLCYRVPPSVKLARLARQSAAQLQGGILQRDWRLSVLC
jgi:hypothetical protein